MSIVCVSTRVPGTCTTCRHANQETMDFEEGIVHCQIGGGARKPSQLCSVTIEIPHRDTPYYLYEPYDGTNCTWGAADAKLEVHTYDDA